MAEYGKSIGTGVYDPRGPPIMNQMGPPVINVGLSRFGTHPISITCQFCKTPITTNVVKSCSCCAVLLCFFTGLFIWICIQCCRDKEINCCDATHYCPNCGQMLGHYESC